MRRGVAVAALVLAFGSGFAAHADAPDRLPHCAEDEVWEAIDFPPASTADLRCVHIDVIAAEVNG